MILGLFLAIGESLKDLESKGQLKRLLDYNIRYYSKNFEKVFIFTYGKETYKLPKNCYLITNKKRLHRYLYSILLSFIQSKEIRQCNVLRGLQITGGIPAFISKLVWGKNYVINYGYNYPKFAMIEGKIAQALLFPVISLPIMFFARKVIITSEFLEKYVIKSKAVLIPNGVDIKKFKPKLKKRNKLIFVGRIVPQKNLTMLFRAISTPQLKNLTVSIIGEGPQMSLLKKITNEQSLNVKFYGIVDYTKLPAFYSNASIFVLPSLLEGNPKSLLEAMACGCIPIGTNVKGINDVIKNGQNGILVDLNQESLKNAIGKIIKNKRLSEKLSKNSRSYIVRHHDINKLLQKEIKLLKQIAQS